MAMSQPSDDSGPTASDLRLFVLDELRREGREPTGEALRPWVDSVVAEGHLLSMLLRRLPTKSHAVTSYTSAVTDERRQRWQRWLEDTRQVAELVDGHQEALAEPLQELDRLIGHLGPFLQFSTLPDLRLPGHRPSYVTGEQMRAELEQRKREAGKMEAVA